MCESEPGRCPGELRRLCGFVAILFAGLLIYSQTLAFSWDEGFHLLAAQLIKAGRKPYLDFCFPQTPLNAYLTAGWMRLFGETWRAVHVLSAIYVAGAAFLTADFLLSRFPVREWRFAAALAGACAVALNSQVVLFGTIGQSYGLCLLLLVAAFRTAVMAVERRTPLWAAATGLLAGAAAASSLLSAPAAPVLLVWIVVQNRSGSRWLKLAAFVLAGAVPFVPVLLLYLQGPKQTLFNLLLYQIKYRRSRWAGAIDQDISALSAWINSAQGLSMGLLAAAGLWFTARKSDWPQPRRAELYLSLWLAAGVGAELAATHPTFERYFLLVVPFVAIPAIAGLYAAAIRLDPAGVPMRATLCLCVLIFLGLGRAIYDDKDSYSWKDCQIIASRVDSETPRGASLWADELTYFLTRRPPPDGMEFAYAHDVSLPPDQAAALHILPLTEIQRRAKAGNYATIAACANNDDTDVLKLPDLYRQQATVRDCTIYWDWAGRK